MFTLDTRNYAYAGIDWNGYHQGYTITLETQAYHDGDMVGRHEQGRYIHQYWSVNVYPTAAAAVTECQRLNVTPYFGRMIYHVNGKVLRLGSDDGMTLEGAL